MEPIHAVRPQTAIATSVTAGVVAPARDLPVDVELEVPEEVEPATTDGDAALAPDRAADHPAPAVVEDRGTGNAWTETTGTRRGIASTSESDARRDCRTSKRNTSVVTMKHQSKNGSQKALKIKLFEIRFNRSFLSF